jgi:hypothetical protein|tara:strand:- start:1272 stop:1517 length:246 start_codon:yes stop_codon:yes gene_type:complete
MFSLDKQAVLKNARSKYKKTTSQNPTAPRGIGVSDRSSLSKRGNHHGGVGHGYTKERKEYCGIVVWLKVPYSRQAGAGKTS